MTSYGYTIMTEQSGPKELVGYAVDAERAGFDFEVSSDHYSPWLVSQGHSAYAWTLLGAIAQATERVGLATYVTCPTMRYHPAVVAQKAATLQLLSDGRFTLGLGAGENLNEHTVGQGWPMVSQRHDMFEEAITIIRELHSGELVTWEGEYFRVDSARIWDLPEDGVPIGLALSSSESIARFAPLADDLITTDAKPELLEAWSAAGKTGRSIGQVPICWAPTEEEGMEIAHDQFRWFGGGWSVNSDLPTTAGFEGASAAITPEKVAESIPCGPDLDAIVETVKEYAATGFTDVALVQVGDIHQQRFLDEVAEPLLEKLRA
jgi:G6PDH family F420-dependent oxidoreductase